MPPSAATSVPESRDDLRAQLARLLGIPTEQLEVTENLVGYGMDSVSTITLLGRWQDAGVALSYGELAEAPSVEGWWRALRRASRATEPDQVPSAAAPVPEPVDPAKPFALTPVQHAYWIGRNDTRSLGGVGCHAYLEFDAPAGAEPTDPDALERAMLALTVRHPMLRAKILDDGRQQFMDRTPRPGLTVHDLRGADAREVAGHTERMRADLGHRILDSGGGEVFDLRLSRLPDGDRLHLDVDLIVADVLSIQLLLAQLGELYAAAVGSPDTDLAGRQHRPTYTFAHYLRDRRARQAEEHRTAREYWLGRRESLRVGGPALPVVTDERRVARPVFSRRTHRLAPDAWQRLSRRARARNLTPSMVLATGFAEVLGRWSNQRRLLLNVPVFDRRGGPETRAMIADFTTLVLLELETGGPDPFADRVARAQRQLAADVSHSAYSAVEVLRELNREANSGGGHERVSAPVVFASGINSDFVDAEFARRFGEMSWMVSQTPQVWLDHQLYLAGGGLLLTWDSVDELFPEGMIDAMFGAYVAVVDAVAGVEDRWLEPLVVPLPEEQVAARAVANATAAPIPDRLLHLGILDQAARTPDSVAVAAGGRSSTYRDLVEAAWQLAGRPVVARDR